MVGFVILILILSSLPFSAYYLQNENITFQLDWDDQVNFVDNILLKNNHGSLYERASRASGTSGIFLGVWEPVSLWIKIILAQFSARNQDQSPDIRIFLFFGICVHVINGYILCLLVVRLENWIRPFSPHSKGWTYGSFVGVMIWCLHPLKVETVCWMSCLPYVISLCFSLLGFHMLLCINNIDSEDDGASLSTKVKLKIRSPVKERRKRAIPLAFQKLGFGTLFTLCYLCAICSKAASLPVLGVYLVFQVFIASVKMREEEGEGPIPRICSGLVRPILAYFSSLIVVAIWGANQAIWANSIGMKITEEHPQNALKIPRHLDMDGFALGSEETPEGLFSADWWWERSRSHRLAKAAYTLTWYISAALLPKNLCIFYPVHRDFTAQQMSLASSLVALITLVTILFTVRMLTRRLLFWKSGTWLERCEYASITWLCYLGILFPTLGILFEHGWPIYAADRYAYIPSALMVPWCAAIGAHIFSCLSKMSSPKRANHSLSLLFLTVALMSCLSLQSLSGAAKWANSASLWQHAVTYGPKDVVAHYNLGCVYEREGKLQQASSLFEQALSIDNSYGAAWNNWGFIREGMHDLSGAEQCYRKAISLNPTRHYTAHNNIAKLLHMHGSLAKRKHKVRSDAAEIIKHYSEAVRIFPQYGKALYNLATYLHTLPPEDLQELREAQFSTASYDFGDPNFDLFQETVGLYRRAITVAPHLSESYHNLASLLLTHHDSVLRSETASSMLIEARMLLDHAVQAFPDYSRPRELIPLVDSAWKRLPSKQ